MTREDHIKAVEAAIDRAGGPDRIRFSPVAVEMIDATKQGVCPAVAVGIDERNSGLIDITFRRTYPSLLPLSDWMHEVGDVKTIEVVGENGRLLLDEQIKALGFIPNDGSLRIALPYKQGGEG